MPPPHKSRFWSRLRLAFRGFRILVWLLVLAVLGGLIYLDQHGLPEFAKQPLLERLRARGLELQTTRMRLRFFRGLVADDVKFGRAESNGSPRLTARHVDVSLDYLALVKGRLIVTAVGVNRGRLVWPVSDPNRPGRELSVDEIGAYLRLVPGDEWALDHFSAAFAGADFTLAATVTNASAVRDWPWLRARPPSDGAQQRARKLADALDRIHFTARPALHLVLTGDARDLQSFAARLTLKAPDADTPWGRLTNGTFTARLFHATNRAPAHAELRLQAQDARTPWAAAAGFDLELRLKPPATQADVADADLIVKVDRAETRWATLTNGSFTAHWQHSPTNPIPLSGHGELEAATAATRWAKGDRLRATATLATPTNPPPADASWAWWSNIQPYFLDWTAELSQVRTEKLDANRVVCAGYWRPPGLIVTNLHARFPDGALDVRAGLDVASREVWFALRSNFDAKKIAPLLPVKQQRWLDKYSWQNPPVLVGQGAVILPAWTNRQPDWREEVWPTLRLAGEFVVTNGTYRGVPADWARSTFTYTNLVWELPDLEAGRPEGAVRLAHTANDRTREYYWRIHSTIDPGALRPLLTPRQQRGFDLLELSQPPVMEGEVRGRFRQHETIGFEGRVVLTNFSVRGESASYCESALRYTNGVLDCVAPILLRGAQVLKAEGITVAFNEGRIYFTNGFSTAEPLVVARAIGPKTGRTMSPYRFLHPPTVQVNGYAPLRGAGDADLRFDVDGHGTGFAWWKFNVTNMVGQVHWRGDTLTLTNLRTGFYGGDAAGSAHFDFSAEPETEFDFTAGVTNASLPLLLADLSARTNRLEGVLSGWLAIDRANTADARSWMGTGRARLRDGYLWEIPIFGVLSKPLDVLMPGVANSRFSDASARFVVTNGVVVSDKLEMRAATMRLQYDGTVDFDGRVDMRVEAEPLRDAWVIGRVLSLALWPVSKLFQYRVTGALGAPDIEPVYVPKLLLFPLRPLRTMEEWFAPEPAKTNGAPVFQELP